MRLAASVFLLAVFSIPVSSQDPSGAQGKVKHVIVVIQENRTPDNLFAGDTALPVGANVATTGLKKNSSPVTLTALPMYTCYDLGHTNEDFQDMWDGGAMDGAYDEQVLPGTNCTPGSNPEYHFAQNDTNTNPPKEVEPYFDIASNYGFANYMFQTNQGPSFPAHQFLFSGTSAPVFDDADGGSYWQWFAAENPGNGNQTGCFGSLSNTIMQINPAGQESLGWTNNYISGGVPGYTCYNHNTIADVLDPAGITWKYYTNQPQSLWTAPNAIQKICNATTAGGGCVAIQGVNTDWNNVISESTNNRPANPAQILQDISDTSCSKLANVSFVTPDGAWSDHAGCKYGGSCTGPALGPAWVAAIVDSVGASNCGYWNNTVILITWDDWGGWYDHVSPPSATTGYSGGNGNGLGYVYGFRVPLLVVSGYSPKPGYVSGPGANTITACPTSPNSKYCHDFGSILNFIEWVFGSAGHSLGNIYGIYPYADFWAMDGPNSPTCVGCTYSLSDFFNFKLTQPNSFIKIDPPVSSDGSTTYDANYFINYTGAPQPPDED